jgi:hypothetical protein
MDAVTPVALLSGILYVAVGLEKVSASAELEKARMLTREATTPPLSENSSSA